MANTNITLSATDQVSGTLDRIASKLSSMESSATAGAASMSSAFANLNNVLGTLGVGLSVGALVSFLKEGITKAMDADKAFTQLQFSINAAAGSGGFGRYQAAVEASVQATAAYAHVTEDVAQSALQALITKTGKVSESMANLNLVFDISRALGKDYAASAQILSLSMEGNTTALKKQVPEFVEVLDEMDKHIDRSEKAGIMTEFLRGKTEGLTTTMSRQAAAFADQQVRMDEFMKDAGKASVQAFFAWGDFAPKLDPVFSMFGKLAAAMTEDKRVAELEAKAHDIGSVAKAKAALMADELTNADLKGAKAQAALQADMDHINMSLQINAELEDYDAAAKARQEAATKLQADATRGLAAAVSVLRSAQEGLNTVNDRAFDARLAKQGTVDDKLRLLRGAVGDTTDPKELEKLLTKTNALRSEAVQQGQTSAEADAKLLDLERQRETVAAQSIMGSQAQLESRRASLDAVDQQIAKQKEFINSLAASGGQSTDDVDRMAKDINTKLKDAYQTTLDGATGDFLNLSKAMNDGKVPADEYATLLRDGFNSASEQARKLRADVESVNAALSSLNNNNLEAFALAKQTVANNNQVLLAAALAKKTSDPTSGGGLTDAERAQAEADYQNRLSSDINSSLGGGNTSGWGGTSSTQPAIDFSSVIPAFARGGIVRRPTLALVGEAGPEAIVPLNGRTGGAAGITVNLTVHGGFSTADEIQRTVRDVLVPQLKEAMR